MPPVFRSGPVQVRVPATSANLGPAFDSAGLALTLHDTVSVQVTPSGLSVEVAGEGAEDLPRSERHLVVKALRATFEALGGQPSGLALTCANRIPQSRGLGSSSAAICAAVLAARALVEGGEQALDDDAALALATRLEGHPDNVAACLRGGATFAWTEPDGRVGVARIDPAASLAPVAFVPPTRASTAKVRGLLPATVPHADAAANAGRTALLPLALTSEPGLLFAATHDLLHQGYRASAMPGTAALVRALRAEGVLRSSAVPVRRCLPSSMPAVPPRSPPALRTAGGPCSCRSTAGAGPSSAAAERHTVPPLVLHGPVPGRYCGRWTVDRPTTELQPVGPRARDGPAATRPPGRSLRRCRPSARALSGAYRGGSTSAGPRSHAASRGGCGRHPKPLHVRRTQRFRRAPLSSSAGGRRIPAPPYAPGAHREDPP